MTRPEDIPEWAWGEAVSLALYPEVDDGGRAYLPADDRETIARALLAAEQRGAERERERCAGILINAAEQWEMYDEFERASEFRDLAAAIRNGDAS